MKGPSEVDFLILASLDDEFRSLRSVFGQADTSVALEENRVGRVYRVQMRMPTSEKVYSEGLICSPGKAGRVSAAIFATYLLGRFDPRFIALTGIAGGLQRSIHKDTDNEPVLGDVVFADSIIDIDKGKIVDGNYMLLDDDDEIHVIDRPRTYHISDDIIDRFHRFQSDKYRFHSKPQRRVSSEFYNSQSPRSFIGPVLSSEVVVASQEDGRKLASRASAYVHRFPIAVEMEGSGVAEAIETIGGRSIFFLIKGISDYADASKAADQDVQRYVACENAAIVTRNFIEYLARAYSAGGRRLAGRTGSG